MTFFYDLNKKLDAIREKPETTHKQLNERDMSRAAKGYEKYGKEGMEALAKAGREGKDLDPIRKKYDKYDESVEEGSTGDYSAKKARAGKDIGKPGKNFEKIAKSAGERYGSKERGEKVAGAVLAKLRAKEGVGEGIEDRLKDLDPKNPVNIPAYQRKAAEQGGPKKDNKKVGETAGMVGDRHEGFPRFSGGKPAPEMPKSKTGGPRFSGGGGYTGKGIPPAPVKETGSTPMTAKQKKFAALAEPKDKVTFADKIAGAKKEVDEMLGDVAANAMKSAVKGRQETDEGWDDMLKDVERRSGQMKRGEKIQGHKGEIEKTATGIKHTRRYDDKTGETDTGDEDGQPVKRGRGRPKKAGGPAQERITARSRKADRTTYQGKKKATEGADDPAEHGEYDREGDMALDDIDTIQSAAQELQSIIDADENLPEWVQSKINKAMDYLDTARDYMSAQGNDEEPVTEKAVSKKQQKFMGMVHAAQKGEKPASKEVAKVAKEMPKKAAKDFASTKHEGLPEKKKPEGKKKEKTEEAGGTSTPTASSGFSFGKGIYDSINRELEDMIAESMNVSMNMSSDPHGGPTKSLTVTATDEDAEYLGKLLKMAGVGGSGGCGCGSQPCSCGDKMDEAYGDTEATENTPDYPTNTETSSDALQYAGGLNKPKSTGQTTVPVIASQEERQHSYADVEEDAIRRMMEMAGIKKKEVEEEKTEEGNLFTGNLAKARAAGKKEADLDGDGDMEKVRESIFTLTNQWKEYKG